MKKKIEEELTSEYVEFMSTKEMTPPSFLTQKLLGNVEAVLSPSPFLVLGKLTLVVFIVGLLNLILCPQFGVGFVKDSGLYEFFMRFGHNTCKAFCGAFFLGSGLLLATFILRIEDLKVLHQYRFLQISAISSISLICFIATGGSVYFTVALYWLLGALLGGIVCLEFGFKCRRLFALR
jgi:hypothetical protein